MGEIHLKIQWNFILALLFALIVAIFAVINVDSVQIDYLFGTANIPLILIILSSALLGGFITGSFGLVRSYKLQKQIKSLTKEKAALEKALEEKSAIKMEKTEQKKDDKLEKADNEKPKNSEQ